MTRTIRMLAAVALPISLILSGCSLFEPPEVTSDQIDAELAELQGLIPMLEAGLAVAAVSDLTLASPSTVGRAGAKTINAGVVFPDGETPREVFGDGVSSNGWVRYPYTDGTYILDFYGTEGNEAEFDIAPYDTTDPATANIFEVRLRIYPTLSTTVNYVLEEYLVAADDAAWALVDETGAADPLYYLTNRTVYFDGTVQEHEVVSNSVSTGTFYNTLFDDTVDSEYLDLTSALYLYPGSGADAEEPAAYAGADAEYSAKVVSKIADTGTTVVEYYTEIDDGTGEIIKSAVSYVIREYISGKLEESSRTVRRYIEYPDGTKTVRARTVSTTSFASYSSGTKIITEQVDVDPSGGATSGAASFSSITTATAEDGTELYTTEVSLSETAADSDAYTGTSSHTTSSGTETYTVSLDDPSSGGIMTVGGSQTSVFYPVSRREAKDIVADLRHGGSFTGKLKGNVISGIYKALTSDDTTSIEAALSFVYAITGNSVQLQ